MTTRFQFCVCPAGCGSRGHLSLRGWSHRRLPRHNECPYHHFQVIAPVALICHPDLASRAVHHRGEPTNRGRHVPRWTALARCGRQLQRREIPEGPRTFEACVRSANEEELMSYDVWKLGTYARYAESGWFWTELRDGVKGLVHPDRDCDLSDCPKSGTAHRHSRQCNKGRRCRATSPVTLYRSLKLKRLRKVAGRTSANCAG